MPSDTEAHRTEAESDPFEARADIVEAPTDVKEAIGQVLRDERLEQERTLADVSEAAWVSLQYLSEIERGRKDVSSELLAAVCRGLDVTVPDVLEQAADRMRGSACASNVRLLAAAPSPSVRWSERRSRIWLIAA